MENLNCSKSFAKWQQRVFVFQAIYSELITNQLTTEKYKNIHEYNNWGDFEKTIYSFYLLNKDLYISKIQSILKEGWEIERLNVVILAVMLEAITEFHALGTKYQILINESVKTTKKYGDDNEYKLINGVLNKYFKS